MARKKKAKKTKYENSANLVCPDCKQKWAVLHFNFNSVINEDNLEILIKKFPCTTEKKELRCTNCGYVYKNVDIFRNILNENIC